MAIAGEVREAFLEEDRLLDSAEPGSHVLSLILFHILCEEGETGLKLPIQPKMTLNF